MIIVGMLSLSFFPGYYTLEASASLLSPPFFFPPPSSSSTFIRGTGWAECFLFQPPHL